MDKKRVLLKKTLVIGIIILLNGMSIIPSTAIDFVKRSSTLTLKDSTMYVGGIGEDNYTRIQDAIDDASDGDTVFVYNDSAPYYENILVNKSIKLIGENKDTTIIDGKTRKKTVMIVSDNVFLYGFCIQNSRNRFDDSGIFVESSSCSISSNIIKANNYGIYLKRSSGINIYENIIINNSEDGLYMDFSFDNIVYNNSFVANHWNAITLENSSNNTFSSNIIKNNEFIGIDIFKSSNNTIMNNYISENSGCGINIDNSCFNKVYRNTITNNIFSGIVIEFSYQNYVYQNNFMYNNFYNAVFSFINKSHCKNIWRKNFWNRPRLLPKPIMGIKILVLNNSTIIPIPCSINIDWHPAKEPYDI